MIKRSEKEYRKLDKLSSTDIRLFATKGRKAFYWEVVNGKRQPLDSRSVLIGSLTHCLLLEPEEFDKRYFMSICEKKPSGKMLEFVEALYKRTLLCTVDQIVTKDFKTLATEAKQDSGFSYKLETIIEAFSGKDPENYYNELRSSGDKQVVCAEDLKIAESIVGTIKTHRNTQDLFKGEKEVQVDNFQIAGLEFKAMLDDVEIKGNKVFPSDLKVTWDNENFYNEYYLKKRNDLQALIYHYALKSKYPDKEVQPIKFVAADSTNNNDPLIYQMSFEDLEKSRKGFWHRDIYYKGLDEIIENINWHLETNIWSTTMENYKNNGLINLDKYGNVSNFETVDE